jgi:hypothetical protein
MFHHLSTTTAPTSATTVVTTGARLFAATGLALGLSLTSAGPASAAVDVFADARGDMAGGADIHRVRVANGEDFVRVKVKHDDLRRSYRSGSSLGVFLDTDRDRSGAEYVFLGGTFEGSDYALLRADGWKAASRRAVPLRCGYRMRLDFAKDTAIVTMDRGCLADPGAVRVEVRTGDDLGPDGDGTARDWLGGKREFTPWVKRG